MARVLLGVVIAIVVLMVFAAADCALFDKRRIRAMPKIAWLVVIVLFPAFGAVLWFVAGRGRAVPRGVRVVAPDDDIDFLRGLNQPRGTDPSE